MTRKNILSAICAGAVIGATIAAANGFVLINPPRKWFQGEGGAGNDLPVLFLVNQNGESSVADADNGVTAVRNALEEWEDELSGTNPFSTGTTSSNANGLDGSNVVSSNDPGRTDRNANAVTLVISYDTSQT